MTEHVLNFAIGIDDDGIRNAIQDHAEKEITNNIKRDIINHIFTGRYYNDKPTRLDSSGNVVIDSSAMLSNWAKEMIIEVVEEHKDEIFDRAAQVLAEKYSRTKAFKERMT